MNLNEIKTSWDRITEGWFGNIIYIILGFVIAYSINIGLGIALDTETPVVDVVSCSMFPVYNRGDMLLVVGEKNPQVGDVVVYNAPSYGYPIIHRIIKINEDGSYQTHGDNNSGQFPFEKQINISQIKGKAVLKIPYLGWVKLLPMKFLGFLNQPLEFCSKINL